jgi:hypothetical protein
MSIAKESGDELEKYLEEYRTWRNSLITTLRDEKFQHDYHNIVFRLESFDRFDDENNCFADMLERIFPLNRERREDDCPDFAITPLMRFLCTTDKTLPLTLPDINLWTKKLFDRLFEFQFWPIYGERNERMKKITFWSENHLLMTLSNAYLLENYLQKFPTLHDRESSMMDQLRAANVSKLLEVYLAVHTDSDFEGIYEVNSIVYLPYSIYALLNLIDFAEKNSEIKQMSEKLLDTIVRQLMLCTDPLHGIANLVGKDHNYHYFST